MKKFSLLGKKYCTSLAIGAFASVFSFVGADTLTAQVPLRYQKIAGFQTERAFESAAEIVTYDKTGKKLLFMNALAADVTILDMSNPNGTLGVTTSIPLSQYGSAINSIAVYDTLAVAVMENLNPNNPQGTAVFFSTSGRILAQLQVGAQPDMVTFTKDGTKVIVANEGEPRDEYAEDPEGSISIINVAAGLIQNNVTTLLFTDFNLGGSRESEFNPSIHTPTKSSTRSQNLEPEYITISEDSRTAWVTLQENNSVAVINLQNNTIAAIAYLGDKDYSLPQNAFDASDRDGGINIRTHSRVKGMYQPDGIASYSVNGQTYLITANEGDARAFERSDEEIRVGSSAYVLDPEAFPDATTIKANSLLGRLRATSAKGDAEGDGDIDTIFIHGGRSFSIWDGSANLIFDSGNEFERVLAQRYPELFNGQFDDESGTWVRDSRSDDKGPEPENVVVGTVGERTYAFIGIERFSGIMVYDVTNPQQPRFVDFFTSANYSGNVLEHTAGDASPEGLLFIPSAESPTGKALLVVAFEYSGSVAVYQIDEATSVQDIPDIELKPDFLNKGILPYAEYKTGRFFESAAEILAYDSVNNRIIFMNSVESAITALNLASTMTEAFKIDLAQYGSAVNSVSVHNSLIAVAMENSDPTNPMGSVVFLDLNGNFLKQVNVGAQPDMITFTKDGKKVLTANEGEPRDSYEIDPEGSVSIIDISAGIESLSQNQVSTLLFTDFNIGGSRETEFNPDIHTPWLSSSSRSQNLEPEYIAIADDSQTAYVTLQENNAVAVIDLSQNRVAGISYLGFKDHTLFGNGLDASDRNSNINITNYPVRGLYQPDAIATYSTGGKTYLVTANEGDARDYDRYSEEVRIGSSGYVLDSASFPNASTLKNNAAIGRLRATNAKGDIDKDGDIDQIYIYGARSFSIWDKEANLVYDSGDDFESILGKVAPDLFNGQFDDDSESSTYGRFVRKVRSDDKGVEPEGLAIGEVQGNIYAFIGLERISAIAMYNITNPNAPYFVNWYSSANYQGNVTQQTAGNVSPEGLLFLPNAGPNNTPLLCIAYEGSGSIEVLDLEKTVSVAEQQRLARNIIVGPNPSDGKFTVSFTDGFLHTPAVIEIFNVLGDKITEQHTTQNAIFDISYAPAGMYILRITSGNTIVSKNLIVR